MTHKQNKGSKQSTDKMSNQIRKSSDTSNTPSKARDPIIPTKDKSPDDLEILDS